MLYASLIASVILLAAANGVALLPKGRNGVVALGLVFLVAPLFMGFVFPALAFQSMLLGVVAFVWAYKQGRRYGCSSNCPAQPPLSPTWWRVASR